MSSTASPQKSGLAPDRNDDRRAASSRSGYRHLRIGKWHLGGGEGRPEYRPMTRGFDEFFGTLANTPFYHPTQFIDSRLPEVQQGRPTKMFYTTDARTPSGP